MPTGRSSLAPRPRRQSHPQPGWVEQSAAEIWDSVRAAVADCLGRTTPPPSPPSAWSTRESLVLWGSAERAMPSARC